MRYLRSTHYAHQNLHVVGSGIDVERELLIGFDLLLVLVLGLLLFAGIWYGIRYAAGETSVAVSFGWFGGTVPVRVVDGRSGKPIVGATVRVLTGPELSSAKYPVETDADGRAEVTMAIPDFNGRAEVVALALTGEGIGAASRPMVIRDDVIVVILGGGRGTRLAPLTTLRSKPAVPIAGKYRLIDIPLSNCINSGLNRIYVLTQFLSASLHRHIAQTYRFDAFGGAFVDILAADLVHTEFGVEHPVVALQRPPDDFGRPRNDAIKS